MIDSLDFHTASRRHLLVECPNLASTMHLHQALEAAELDGVDELVPAARTVLIRFNPARTSAPVLADRIRSLEHTETDSTEPREVTIDVHYDGEDLTEVADLLSLSTAEVITRHQRATWQVAFSGFAPGFGYLAGDDPIFNVPRRSSPRTRVPVGAVALAGEFTGVYPRASPGGWQLIGRTDATLWDLDREPPALFVPGTIVTFREASRDSVTVAEASAESLSSQEDAPAQPESSPHPVSSSQPGKVASAHAFTVIRPGLQLLIQDLGRPGFAAMGVSSAGAADRSALQAANRLVGNAETTAGLESLGGGAKLAITGAGVAAVTGAYAAITVTSADGAVFRHHLGEAFSLDDGDELELGMTERGTRAYVAFRGGIETETALGSASADTLAHLGPAHLEPDTTVALGRPESAPHLVEPVRGSGHERHLPAPGETIEMSVTLGPRDGWFTSAGVETLLGQDWTVTHESDRVGLRLAGDVPLERTRTGELPSEGAVTGALQVPPKGQPVLFGPDHPLTGGYPIIASVDDTDLAAQLAPGVKIRFVTEDDPRQTDADHTHHSPENGH
ncbi:carboxyltransferase domain-containing protein [Brevibacterium sp. UCMA 11754]|uniref:5-oxoprolinase subunit B/C family protein n=1 Tax=Brevibacterium sp. UCMA 11754 TaxID=2749198 RepID=UPI001F3B7CBA|nr:carboxyltransferase domain-containing protein [Brevibacterium sp. UCMA 11754]MCF2573162.1 carboxyltransferase domain-containing protein [Brevibacterium sp. UCMA 11754]